MHVEVVEFWSANCRWDLVESYLRHRRNVFIGQKRWSLVSYGALEFDQYDVLPAAVYVVAHSGGKVIGGARLLRCDTRIGTGPTVYSYMIRDAARGVISLPRDVCWDEPPDDAESWELTRLLTVKPSMAVVKSILDAANVYLARHKAQRCLFLGPQGFMRMAQNFGYDPQPLGNIVRNDDGAFLAFACPVRHDALQPLEGVSDE